MKITKKTKPVAQRGRGAEGSSKSKPRIAKPALLPGSFFGHWYLPKLALAVRLPSSSNAAPLTSEMTEATIDNIEQYIVARAEHTGGVAAAKNAAVLVEKCREFLRNEQWLALAETMLSLGIICGYLNFWEMADASAAAKRNAHERAKAGGDMAKAKRESRERPIQERYREYRKRGHTDRQAVNQLMQDKKLVTSLGRDTVRRYTNPIRDALLIQEAYRNYRNSGSTHQQAIDLTFRDEKLIMHFNRNKKSVFSLEVVRKHANDVRCEFD